MSFSTKAEPACKRCLASSRRSSLLRQFGTFVAGLLMAAHVSAGPFDNGFEAGLGGWVVDSEADPVVIVGTEGPDQFPVYDDLNVTVEPNLGDYMLRMGTPKAGNETQTRGVNAISQQFDAGSSQISIALRLFSLDHRGDDTLRISLRDSAGNAILSAGGFDFGNGQVCDAPCEVPIDTGKRKDVIKTPWQVMVFTGLVVGQSYTLSIELEAGQNESLASWLYVDGVNEEPTAVINFNPGSAPGTAAVEGDFVVFDCLQSADPEAADISCIWTAQYPGVSAAPIIGSTVVYSFPDDGSGTINLEVSDGEVSASASTPISIQDQTSLVNALDVEVLPGGTVDLLCRFADPGVQDTHALSFQVDSGAVQSDFEVVEENVPALSSGFARASYEAPSDPVSSPTLINGTCNVSDGGSDDFTITILPPADLASRATANTGSTLTPQLLNSDKSNLGALTDPNGVAVYEIRLPGGQPLPQGTEVSVTAHFPVDYDIAILNGSSDPAISAAPWVSAPFVSAPFVSAPFVSVPFVSAPFVSAPFVSAPFVSAPFVSAPFVSAPFVSAPFVSAPFVSAPFVSAPVTTSLWTSPGFVFENFPLSQLAGAPDGSNISGIDVSFQDLGAQNTGGLADEAVFVKGLSAEFGTSPEQLLVEVGPGERGLYLAVIPQAGSFSAAPFSLEIETAVPPPTASLLGDACIGTSLVSPENSTATAEVLRSGGGTTLVVTQKQRMMATFGLDEAAWGAWMTAMEPFFSHPKVDATVISVPSTWYDEADNNPCVVAEQNAVAQQIKSLISDYRAPQTKFVQLMGSLDIVMPYYLPDETQTGNESLFASDLLTQPGTPLGVAIGEGYMLTDAYYVDADPQPFNGRLLYLEDISVSRLVETPDEILANAQRFVDTDGVINLLSVEAGTPSAGTQSTGYDFFVDGTDEINRILTTQAPLSSVPSTTLNNETWDAQALRCQFFGTGQGCTKPVSALNAVNAHMSYNGGLTAKGFNCAYLPEQFPGLCSAEIDPLGEVVLSSESAGIYEDPDEFGPAIAINGITFSIGCHSGLSVPDAWGLSEELGLPLDPARDWVQELGTWVGSYNFAYGDTDVPDRGTEGIMPLVISRFAGGMTLGEALIQAKWQYGAGLFEFGVYDEKSLVGLSLFGMPQATLEGSVTAAASTAAVVEGAATGSDLIIDYVEENTTTQTGGPVELNSNEKGVWYSVFNKAQAIVGRPLLPVIKPFELRPVGNATTIHAVALRGGSFTTYLDQDPVFPAQTHDLVTTIAEPQPCVETLSPSLIASVNRFDSPDGTLQSFIVQPGQFRCTDTPAEQQSDGYVVNGDFRIWNTIDLELLHPSNASLDSDLRPPAVTRQDLLGNPETGVVTATLDAEDENGIREIIALVYKDDDGEPGGTGTATPYSVTERNADGVFELLLPDAFSNLLSFQYIDNAGNITAKTLKGALLRAIEVSIRTSIISLADNTQIIVEIGDFATLFAPYLTIDFGDGSEPLVIELNDPGLYTLNPDGSATVVINHDYSALDAPSVTVTVEVRAAGALGTDQKTLSACSDPRGDVEFPDADIVGCGVTSSGTDLAIDVIVDGVIAPDIQYRLFLPQTNTQLKYANGAVTGPKKLKPMVVPVGDNQLKFLFNAARIGWDGVSTFEFVFETQDGVAGGQGQGFVDQTDVKTYLP